MKGIMFNLLEEVVNDHYGEQAWDGMLDRAGAGGSYTSLGNYGDDEFARLLGAVSRKRGASDREALKWFGECAMPYLAERYPEFFEQHGNMRSFLLSLNEVIHAEVRKLYPDADVPVFGFETPLGEAGHDTLLIHYRSKRRLCQLAEGFIDGAAKRYGERVEVSQSSCMLDGAEECLLVCRFRGPAGR